MRTTPGEVPYRICSGHCSTLRSFPGITDMISSRELCSLLNRLTRRDVLRVSVGTGLSFLLPTLESRAADRRGRERPKSLITLWMGGGPSQLETWDPHPESKHSGGETRAIETTVPGLK